MRRRHLTAHALAAIVSVQLMATATGADPVQALIPRAAEVDTAIERSLQYLRGQQAPEGFFEGKFGRSTGVVSLCGMAFLAKGYTPGSGPYGTALTRCIDYVLSMQKEDGMLTASQSAHGPMYSHNIATLFLAEVSGMVAPAQQVRIGEVLARAVEVIIKAQEIEKPEQHRGGWRYQPGSSDSDLSCSGWALMALRSARLNGAPVPDKAIADARTYILRNRDSATGRFGYQDTGRNAIVLTGAGLLCLELTGSHGDETTFAAGRYILNTYEKLPQQEFPYYGLYYSAQGTFQLGGYYWQRLSEWMYDYWLPLQREDGTWEIFPSCWMNKNGQNENAYITAMMVLSFAVPYRQLPIYQRDETVDDERE